MPNAQTRGNLGKNRCKLRRQMMRVTLYMTVRKLADVSATASSANSKKTSTGCTCDVQVDVWTVSREQLANGLHRVKLTCRVGWTGPAFCSCGR